MDAATCKSFGEAFGGQATHCAQFTALPARVVPHHNVHNPYACHAAASEVNKCCPPQSPIRALLGPGVRDLIRRSN